MASFNAQRTLTLLERALTTAEPTAALRALTALREEIDALERHQVGRALREGKTFTAIAKPLGISRQAAHRRYRDLASPATPALSDGARAALLRAREEAALQGSGSIAGEHLLIALAESGALKIDVEAARRSFAPPAINAAPPAGLHPALHARLSRGTGPLGVDHLLRAVLDDPAARQLLDRFG